MLVGAVAACASAHRPPAEVGPAQAPTATSVAPSAGTAHAVRAAVTGFMDALNRLDVPDMDRHFADDVTAFVPQAQAELAVGRGAVTDIFRRFADRVRPTTPRLALVPRDLRVAVGDPLAVATLHVRDGDGRMLRRRTFVLRRTDGRWLISHLHASDLAMPAAP